MLSINFIELVEIQYFSNIISNIIIILRINKGLLKIFKDKQYKLLPYLAIIIGLSLQLEAASAVFFIPIIIFFGIINYSDILKIKFSIWIKSVIGFFILLLPQLAFEIKNNFLITKNLFGFLTGRINSDTGKSWGIPDLNFLVKRLNTYYQAFFSKIDTNMTDFSYIFLCRMFDLGKLYFFPCPDNTLDRQAKLDAIFAEAASWGCSGA